MFPAARIASAIEILESIFRDNRPASEVLKEFSLQNRYAGSKDRSAIAGLVYDGLRQRASAAFRMADEGSRACILDVLAHQRSMPLSEIAALFNGERHAPSALSLDEEQRLLRSPEESAADWILGDFPQWLEPHLRRAFSAELVKEGQALSQRAPLDLRVNSLSTNRQAVARKLAHLDPSETPISALGLRIAPTQAGQAPVMGGERAYVKGLVEIQDEGSQVASLLTGAKPGEQVLDLCAGGGGKSLAMAAMMENRGQIYATDKDGRRLMQAVARIARAGARNIQLRTPKRRQLPIEDLKGRCDLVVIDAPCTGTGTWRRHPDAKWRLRPGALAQRLVEQAEILQEGSTYLKPGGRLVYMTCSLLCEENEDQVAEFLQKNGQFSLLDPALLLERAGLSEAIHLKSEASGVRLSPFTSKTDGFFIAGVTRMGSDS